MKNKHSGKFVVRNTSHGIQNITYDENDYMIDDVMFKNEHNINVKDFSTHIKEQSNLKKNTVVDFREYYAMNKYLESHPWSNRFITKTENDLDRKCDN